MSRYEFQHGNEYMDVRTMEVPDRVSIMVTTANLDHGGVEEVILAYAKTLDRHRYTLTVSCLHVGRVASEIASLPGVSVVHIDTRSRVLRFFRIWKLARTVRPAIVHNHACWYGLIAGLLVGARRVETIHNIYHWFTPPERLLYGIYCLLAHKIIAVSGYVRDYTLHKFPFMRQDRLVVIHNGIDISQFQSRPESDSLRGELNIDRNDIVVGFVGRLTEQKGVEYLLSAAADQSLRSFRLKYIIVGEGELLSTLEKKRVELGLVNVIFTGFRRDIPRLLAMFDIFVLPSLWEGLPVGVLEASAAGCPVIATGVSGTPEIIVDGVSGYLVEPKSISHLVEKISILAADAGLRRRMGEAGKSRIAEHFTAERMVHETEKLYREILQRS